MFYSNVAIHLEGVISAETQEELREKLGDLRNASQSLGEMCSRVGKYFVQVEAPNLTTIHQTQPNSKLVKSGDQTYDESPLLITQQETWRDRPPLL